MMYSPIYRSEIDGLRAIAVSAVICFHFFPTYLPLGFLGVDLFFVISGYVITQVIYSQINSGSFTFADFYTRRIKRILPLTFVCILSVVVAGHFLLLPHDFESLTRSAFASATFWSNIYFWRDGGYFGGTDKLKPLLHMWSLSLEEQFYILYPITLWLIIRLFRSRYFSVAILILSLSVVSMLLSAYLIRIGGDSAAFFLMPSRAWQFGAGALAALVVAEGWGHHRLWITLPAFIVVIFCFFVDVGPFYQEFALAISASVFLVGSYKLSTVIRPLSIGPLRWIGLRSFSLYLWHWPIVAFMNYAFVDHTPLRATLTGIALCVILSEISYRTIEVPFRYSYRIGKTVGVILVSSCAIILIALYGSSVPAQFQLASKLSQQVQTNFRCNIRDFIPYGASRACIVKALADDSGNTAILGNSHAQMYAPTIVRVVASDQRGIILVPLNGCMPTVTLNISPACILMAKTNLSAVLDDDKVSRVIIGTTYPEESLVSGDGGSIPKDLIQARLTEALIDLVNRLKAVGKEVWLIGPIPSPGYDVVA